MNVSGSQGVVPCLGEDEFGSPYLVLLRAPFVSNPSPESPTISPIREVLGLSLFQGLMRSINRLFPRSGRGKVSQEDLDRLEITVPKNTILNAADKAKDELNQELGSHAASVALSVALGKLCAESGLSVHEVVAMVELTHREHLAEIDNGPAVAA